MRTSKLLIFSIAVMSLLFVTCSGLLTCLEDEPKEILSKDKTITKVALNINPKVTATVDDATKKITATVPFGTDLTKVTLAISHSGASISPEPKTVQDFSNGKSVKYTVKAEDGTTQDYTVSIYVVSPITATMAWVSMREGVIELKSSIVGLDMGVIVSREATAPAYETVKNLPGFYTRKQLSLTKSRTVYLSMSDKMTTTMIQTSENNHKDGSVAGFNPLTAVPELMHPNTKYYAYIYYSNNTLSNRANVTKIEFTTESYPTAYPTGPSAGKKGATWSDVYSHKDVTIEYKAGEAYFMPIRMYYYNPPRHTPLTLICNRKVVSIDIPIDYTIPNRDILVLRGFLANMRVYNLYKMPSSPTIPLVDTDKNPIWDMMFYYAAKSKFALKPFLQTKIDYKFGIAEFIFMPEDAFKQKLVTE